MKSRVLTTGLLALFVAAVALASDSPHMRAVSSLAQGRIYGKTYGQWSARWWQWAISIPANENPLLQAGEVDCGIGQEGPMWFLAGNFGGAVERSCTIPRGKALLFPLLNAFYFNGPDEDFTVDEKRAELDFFLDLSCQLDSSLDGLPTTYALVTARVQSPTFNVEFPEDNIFGVPAGHVDDEVVSDGHWVIIPALPPGEYEIHFGGAFCDPETSDPIFMPVDVTYFVTVVDD
jgi:hypothetical protein